MWREGSADCQDKKGASWDEKLSSKIRNWVVFQNVLWMFYQFAGVVWCGFSIRGLLVFLVREECLSVVKIGQVENFVSPLRLSSLIEIDRL